MKKKGHERKQVEEHVQLDWVELSEKLNAKDGSAGMLDKMRFERDTNEPEPGAIVNETISQIVSEEYLKVNTEDTVKDTSKDPGDPFYAYDKKRAKKKKEIAASKAAAKPKSASSSKTGTGSKSTASSKTGTKPKKSVKTRSDEDRDEAIRKSVDEKIIIRSEELKKKRRSAGKSKAEKAQSAPEKTSAVKEGVNTIRPEEAFRHTKGLEKFRKMGVLPTKGEGPSEFRKTSANWRYDNIPANIAEGLSDISSESDGDEEGKKGFSPMWWCGAVITAVILISSILATSVYADYRGEINKENAMANLPVFEDDASSIAYTGDKLETDEIELEEAASPIESAEGKMLSLVLTSVEKDLKVKLVDEEDTLVKGVKWGINVTDEDDNESSYEDEDEDGIIHLTGINAGDYSVSIAGGKDLDGYVYPTVGQKVSVKAKVEYKVIANIRDEIKKESEVNAAAEDNGNKAADVEPETTLTDTVEFVESTAEENGEVYEEAAVDLSKTEIISSAFDRIKASLGSIADSVSGVFSRDSALAMNVIPTGRVTAENEDKEEEEAEEEPEEEEEKKEEEEEKKEEEEVEPEEEEEEEEKKEEEEVEEEEEEEEEKKEEEEEEEEIELDEDEEEERKKKRKTDEIEIEIDPNPTPTPTGIPLEGDEKYKDEAQLYDSEKNPLYVYEDGEYRRAKYRDYRTGDFTKFYRKVTGYVYTGWQNIEGKTYYYTKDHEKVTGDQIIGGVTYHFNEDGSLDNGSGVLGIDVSKYQPSINWASVKASGVDFAIIRCGYRGASTGALIEDPCFRSHIKGAKSVGIKVGVYFFSTALNETEAVEEASMCAELCGGYGLNLPVFLDVESSGRPGYNTLSVSQRTSNIRAFCETIASAGYTPGLYANKTWLTEKIDTSALSCRIWLAQYRAEGPTYNGRYDYWQYTSKGHVDGISGFVDMNKGFSK